MGGFMHIPSPLTLRTTALLLIALALASCGPKKDEFAPACPVPGLVRPLSELSRYRGSSTDLRGLVVRARVVDVTGNCEPGETPDTVVTHVQVLIEATRGPAMQGDSIQLPVFVAVTDSGTIYDKKLFWLPVTFTQNIDTARATSEEVRMEIPITQQKSAAVYGIIGGFQLSPEELAIWRRNNPRQ
ncbi:MAG TPA: hypothetical protein VHX39_22535 [Acetobacteraceae bacterium]|nr:hypothetical protein [Acetobacteraceae bacterium]